MSTPQIRVESWHTIPREDGYDLGSSLTGTANYDVFSEVRASSGTSSVFGFTGEQFDAETGFTFLPARYLDPRLGRFLSADSIRPNAPGFNVLHVAPRR